MPNLSLTRVSQKLAQAKILLDCVDEAAITPIHLNSLKEAATFHLICAYQHYLREIAEAYWLKNIINIRTETDLINAFQVAKKQPAEAEELIALRNDANSWLGQLHTYYESLWMMPSVVAHEPESDDLLIKTINLESSFDMAQVNLALISFWHESFIALVMRQRETSAEF